MTLSSENMEYDEELLLEEIPMKEKLAYGLSKMPATFFGGVMSLIQSFYYGWMGLQSGWIVIAQVIYAIWNMVNDPLFGNAINNTKFYNKRKNTYQRYIPYIKFGAPIFSLAFVLVFFPPGAWRGKQEVTIQAWLFVWYLVSQLAYDSMYTLVLCAHVALLPQMTLNRREREKIQIISTVFSLPAVLLGFVVPLMFLTDPNAEKIVAFQILVVVVAIIGVIPYLLVARIVNEKGEHIPEEKMGLIEGLKLAFKNKSFVIYLIYDGVSVFILNTIITTIPFYLTWVLETLPDFNLVLFMIAPLICFLLSIYIELKLAEKRSTKAALSYYLGVISIGFFFTFFVSFFNNWILTSIGFSIVMLGFSGDFIHHEPMRADTIDYDLWKISGERREGLYAGIGPLLSKPMISVALALPTSLMGLFGLIYVEEVGGLVATQGMANAALSLNMSLALIPGIVCFLGFIIWVKFYPLTGEKVREMKLELAKIHDERRKKYLEKIEKEGTSSSKES